MGRYTRIEVETPTTVALDEVLTQIAADVALGEIDGYVRDGDSSLRWEIEGARPTAAIDRRQRLAAAALLMGFDLPEPLETAAASMAEAARLLPGMTTGDLPPLGPNARRDCLEFARRTIDEMLAETPERPARP